MSAAITRNRYKLPPGYHRWTAPGKYAPYSGSSAVPSPARVKNGASQLYTIASVPADLSTFILNPPNGQAGYKFQFIYTPGTADLLTIPILLAAGGASTAAQVQTAMAAVLGAIGGTPLTQAFEYFPWKYATVAAAQFRIDWTIDGTAVAATGTQATITPGAVTVPFFTLGPIIPGSSGHRFSWLAG